MVYGKFRASVDLIYSNSLAQHGKQIRLMQNIFICLIYLFIMALEMLFIQVRNCKEISGIEIFGYELKLSAFADDATYFSLNEHSIQQLAALFSKFVEYSILH